MKNRILISEEEKKRIMSMHLNAGLKSIVSEQPTKYGGESGDSKKDEGPGDTVTYDRDIINSDLFPTLIKNGFSKVVDPKDKYGRPCSKTPKKGEVLPVCCTYLYKGTHETGVNVMIDCGTDGFDRKIVVYNKGNQNTKLFDVNNWEQSVNYARNLK